MREGSESTDGSGALHADGGGAGGAGKGPFPTTHWSRLVHAEPGADAKASSEAALTALAQHYHGPIAAYIRTRWARTDEEAFDAAQDFFVWMLESGFVRRADPERGRFRAFVKHALANFLRDRERRRSALKRGGGTRIGSLVDEDGGSLSVVDAREDRRADDPADVLDRAWRRALFERALTALENELQEKGKAVVFAVFRDYFLSDEGLDYARTAARHGITRVDVSNHLMLAKKRFRAQLRHLVQDTVSSPEDLPVELAWLFEERP